ncbi:Lrp/AsnC family transcriptional regulator [Candidatus Woesearchaeota archaeon]|nr:MAG: Lrp/AsnC family transcriptional regulator [Candidatus Woesearchaeota archaeon]
MDNFFKISEQDWKIINVLKNDSRMSIRDIAKVTKLRPTTVHNRIKRLRQDGVIEKFTIKLDNKKSGQEFIAFLFVLTSQKIDAKQFNNPHIKEVFGVTGEFDLLLKCKFKDITEFNDFLINFRDNNPVKKTMSLVSTCVIKEDV